MYHEVNALKVKGTLLPEGSYKTENAVDSIFPSRMTTPPLVISNLGASLDQTSICVRMKVH